jgi:hypothetical protein
MLLAPKVVGDIPRSGLRLAGDVFATLDVLGRSLLSSADLVTQNAANEGPCNCPGDVGVAAVLNDLLRPWCLQRGAPHRCKWACAQCETLIQAPVDAHVIDKGIQPYVKHGEAVQYQTVWEVKFLIYHDQQPVCEP